MNSDTDPQETPPYPDELLKLSSGKIGFEVRSPDRVMKSEVLGDAQIMLGPTVTAHPARKIG